jgi:hypothetical protein
LVLLSKSNPAHAAEIDAVEAGWSSTGGLGVVVSMHRVQNYRLHRQYEEHKAQLKKDGQLVQEDLRVYHGTRCHAPAKVHATSAGFDPRLGVSMPGSALGDSDGCGLWR